MKPTMKKAALFDMDGTLVDNSPVHVRAFEIFCARYGVTDWKEKLADSFGMGNDDIMRAVMPEEIIREKGLAALADEKEAIYREIYAPTSTPWKGSSNCSNGSAPRASAAPWVRRDARSTSISCSKSAP